MEMDAMVNWVYTWKAPKVVNYLWNTQTPKRANKKAREPKWGIQLSEACPSTDHVSAAFVNSTHRRRVKKIIILGA